MWNLCSTSVCSFVERMCQKGALRSDLTFGGDFFCSKVKVARPRLFVPLPCSSHSSLWVLGFPLAVQKHAHQLKWRIWCSVGVDGVCALWGIGDLPDLSWGYSCLVFWQLEKFQHPPMTLINSQWYLAVEGWKNAHIYFVIHVHHSGAKYSVV